MSDAETPANEESSFGTAFRKMRSEIGLIRAILAVPAFVLVLLVYVVAGSDAPRGSIRHGLYGRSYSGYLASLERVTARMDEELVAQVTEGIVRWSWHGIAAAVQLLAEE